MNKWEIFIMETKQLIFSECVDNFILDKTTNCSPRTVEFYTLALKYFGQYLEKRNIQNIDISPLVIREYFVELKTHRNIGGCHASFRALKCFFNWVGNEYDLIWKNPIYKVKVPHSKIPPLPEIPMEDVRKLLNVVSDRNGLRDKSIIKTLIDTGCRGNELLSLNYEDVNFISGQVTIINGKGGKTRIVYLGKNSLKSLKEYLDIRENIQSSSPLFISEFRERLKFFGLRMIVDRLCKKAGVKNRGVHCFRRLFALTLFRQGIDILTISRLLGHSSLEVTKRYLNIDNSDLKLAIDKASPANFLD
jgi:site-specific recombinase XerD